MSSEDNSIENKKDHIILVSGMNCDDAVWRYQHVVLSEITQVTIVNILECKTLNQIVEKIFDVAPTYFSLVGLSLGGIAALEALRNAPNRIRKLALISSQYGGLAQKHVDQYQQLYQQCLHDDAVYQKNLERSIAAYFDKSNIGKFKAEYLAMATRTGKEAELRHMKLIMEIQEKPFPVINCPTLLIHGETDFRCGIEKQQYIQQNIPHAQLHNIPRASHFVLWEESQRVNELLTNWIN